MIKPWSAASHRRQIDCPAAWVSSNTDTDSMHSPSLHRADPGTIMTSHRRRRPPQPASHGDPAPPTGDVGAGHSRRATPGSLNRPPSTVMASVRSNGPTPDPPRLSRTTTDNRATVCSRQSRGFCHPPAPRHHLYRQNAVPCPGRRTNHPPRLHPQHFGIDPGRHPPPSGLRNGVRYLACRRRSTVNGNCRAPPPLPEPSSSGTVRATPNPLPRHRAHTPPGACHPVVLTGDHRRTVHPLQRRQRCMNPPNSMR